MKLRTAIMSSAATIALAMGSSAQAGGYYVAVFGGISTNNEGISDILSGSYRTTDTEFEYLASPSSHLKNYSQTDTQYITVTFNTSEPVEYDNGWVLGAAIGRDLGHNFRGELEFAYRKMDAAPPASAAVTIDYRIATYDHDESDPFYELIDTIMTTIPQDAGGDVSAWTYMANVWYDFDFEGTNFTPFIGVGVGTANIHLDYAASVSGTVKIGASSITVPIQMSTHLRDSGWVFAYQFGAGVSYDFEGGARLSAQYRYYGTTEAELDGIDQRVGGHNYLLGLSWPLGF